MNVWLDRVRAGIGHQAFRLHRDEIRRLVQQSRASNPRVFGSVLHARDTESSDLDILVDPLPGATLFDLGGLQITLQELLGMPVDLLTPGDLQQAVVLNLITIGEAASRIVNSTTCNLRSPISILGNEADRHLARSAPIG
jgi:predicted nucleotidyltransferase